MKKKKLIMEGGRVLWLMPDGTKRPPTAAEIKRVKSQIGQSNAAKSRKKETDER